MSTAPAASSGQRRRLGDILIADGVITDADLGRALVMQRADMGRRRLGDVLKDLELVDEHAIASALARQLGLQRVEVEDRPPPASHVIDLVPRRIAERHGLLPLEFDEETGRLVIAMADPTNVLALDDVRTAQGVNEIAIVVASSSSLDRGIVRAYEQGAAGRAVRELGVVEEVVLDEISADDANDEPVIRLVNALLADAVRGRGSDVHVEPGRNDMRVRVRVDGILRETQQIPRTLGRSVTSRLKIMSNLDIAERRLPQDGRATIRVDGQEVDLRVSTMPSLHGEKTVMRLLRKGSERLDVDDLGFDERQYKAFKRAISKTQGMILMTGPTGSGKTTTLYAGLATIAAPTHNVVTLEDPVEYELEGINQSQMQPKIGMTFARGLRTILRQDPDVIMVGEIRDPETAGLAVEASVTGHLVLSTLHTNDAPSTIARLTELDVDRFLLATTLTLIIAQRLGRTVCAACSEPYEPDDDTLEQLHLSRAQLADATLLHGTGCGRCEGSGYRGRVGLYEFLEVTPRLRQLISDGGTELQLAALARAEGLRTLRRDALDKALKGVTTLEEVLRVTPDDAFHDEGGSSASEGSDAERERAERRAARVGAVTTGRLLALGNDGFVAGTKRALPKGWTMTSAATVEDAIAHARSERPDIILADEILADGTIFDVLKVLRQEDGDQTRVLLRSTSHVEGSELADQLVAGVTDRIEGTIDIPTLRARLEAALTR